MGYLIVERFWFLGRAFGVVVALITFIGCWIAAIGSWGWLLGISFGWVPAMIISVMAGFIAWVMWLPICLVVLIGGLWWWFWGRNG